VQIAARPNGQAAHAERPLNQSRKWKTEARMREPRRDVTPVASDISINSSNNQRRAAAAACCADSKRRANDWTNWQCASGTNGSSTWRGGAEKWEPLTPFVASGNEHTQTANVRIVSIPNVSQSLTYIEADWLTNACENKTSLAEVNITTVWSWLVLPGSRSTAATSC